MLTDLCSLLICFRFCILIWIMCHYVMVHVMMMPIQWETNARNLQTEYQVHNILYNIGLIVALDYFIYNYQFA